jgi:hypothetical protein
MGVDRDHMDYDGLSQAIPPSYAQLIFGQACMRRLEAEYGLRAITYDEMLESPAECNRYLDHWRRGAGGEDARQGVELTAVSSGERSVSTSASVGAEDRCVAPVSPEPTPTDSGQSCVCGSSTWCRLIKDDRPWSPVLAGGTAR